MHLVFLFLLVTLRTTLASFIHDNPTLHRRNSTGLTDAITWDPHSLSIHGQRTFILSAEMHPWRQPNPNLWLDVFQKIKANGFNTVSFYIHWGLHYPTPSTNDGEGDFMQNTYRDVQRFIDDAKEAGLWMIARPGPYINGETTGGGFPGWVGNIAGDLRTTNSNYTEAWTPYMTSISKIIARNQITNGGPIILVQAENEFSEGTNRSPYMQAIIDTYRENGIEIPITFNDQHGGATGNFSPDLPGTGRVNIYCGDSYPQSNSWTQVQSVYYSDHEAVAPSNPLCLAEFGGGWLLGWGSVARGGVGYEKYTTDLSGPAYGYLLQGELCSNSDDNERVIFTLRFQCDAGNLMSDSIDVYMAFGGTNWGQTAEPTVYTSYDYGAGINENRIATPKMNEMRLQGLFLRVARDLLSSALIANGTNYTSSNLIHTAELRNLESGAGFYVIRHNDTTSEALTMTKLNITTSQGTLAVPRTGNITLDGRESKILVTDFIFGVSTTNVLYSTTEIMTWSTIDDTDYIVFYAPSGQSGETVLQLPNSSDLTVIHDPNIQLTISGGQVILNYALEGTQFATITTSKSKVIVVFLEKDVANNWHAPIIADSGNFGNYFSIGSNETILVSGPYVVRNAAFSGNTLNLGGDLNGTTSVEFIAPLNIKGLVWNGNTQTVTLTAHGTLQATIQGAPSVKLPVLGDWKVSGSLPEADPRFDDSDFVTANLTSTNYTNLPPLAGEYVLYSQQYGFFGGHLVFRGHFNATGTEEAFNLTVQGGLAFGYSAFFNGIFLGSNQGNATVSMTTDVWSIPNGTLKIGEDNVLVVIQDHMGIVETSTNSGKEPRGIRGYSIIGGNTTFSQWKLQGNQGGSSHNPDTFRGYLNEGGLYAERIGAHLPGFPDSAWKTGSPLTGGGVSSAGVNFYRTQFVLDLPEEAADVPIRLSITPSAITSNFRVQIYLNGWQLGKYINNLGPQTEFVLPAGILKRESTNTLALALWALDASGASIDGLTLISDGAFTSSFSFDDYAEVPDYGKQAGLRPLGNVYEPM